ncbi:MAG TPA: hypothetical protein VHE13_13155 [Opitutus sp.]|nr:hypothetical protein [Opitutus sp.]
MNSTAASPTIWFKRWGWLYRPVHPLGFVVGLLALGFLANVFVALDAQARSVADLLYRFHAYAAPTFLGLMWLASRTSDEDGGRT